MKKLIIKTNEWYENLSDIKHLMFFLIVIMGGLIVAEYLMYVKNFIWGIPIWATLILIWRGGYVFVKIKEEYKNDN